MGSTREEREAVKYAVEAERKRVVELIGKCMIPLTGHDRFPDRDTFAAFNMGRLAEALIGKVLAGKRA